MHKQRPDTGFRDVRESLREFRVLRDERMTVVLVCRTRLYVAGTGRNRRLFATVQPQRIVVECGHERREMPVPGAA